MTRSQALKCLAVLAASYPRNGLEKHNLDTYALMLEDLDFVRVGEAMKRLTCKLKWFPSIAEIRAEVAEAELGDVLPAELAWGEVQKAIGRYGYSRMPEWSSNEMTAAVDAIGWRNICLDENVAATRARFIDAYGASRSRALTGLALGGHAQAPRRRIGRQAPIGELLRLGPVEDD